MSSSESPRERAGSALEPAQVDPEPQPDIPAQRLIELLAALPQMLPGTQAVPLGRIRPNPENPGPPVTEEQVQELTVPILADGLVNPPKLRPDPANPLAPGLSPHPDNPRLKADGTPWKVEDFNWMILSGERRWRALNKLHGEGWAWQGGASAGHQASYRLARREGTGQACIPAFVLNPTGEEAVIITHTDNDIRERGWFAGYQSIESLIKANPNLTQRQVAAGLKMDKEKVNRAIGLLPLLNPEARALLVCNAYKSNKGILGISERAASRLADLGPGSGLKSGFKKEGEEAQKLWPYPAIPAGTQELLLRALRVACDQQMTEAGVKTLVQWVLAGNDPTHFDPKAAGKRTSTDPVAHSSKAESESRQPSALKAKVDTSKEKELEAPAYREPAQARSEAGEETPIGEEAFSGTGVAASSTSAYSAGTPRNDDKETAKPAPAAGSAPATHAPQTDGQAVASQAPADPEAPFTGPGRIGQMVLESLAGIPLFKQIQKKVKSGEKLHWWETLYLALHDALKGLAMVGKDGVKPALKFLLKYGKKFVHGFFKLIHGLFKGTADLVAPLPHSSHSSGKHGTRSMTGLSPQALLQVVLHWTVYSLCWLVLGEFLGSRVPSLRPWVEFPFRYTAYLLFREFPAWALAQAPQHLVAALFAAALLAVGLFWGFSKDAVRMTLLIILLGAGWFYGRGWGTATPPAFFGHKTTNPQAVEPPRTPSEEPVIAEKKTLNLTKEVSKPSTFQPSTFKPGAKVARFIKRGPPAPVPLSQSYITSPNVTVPEALKDWVEADRQEALHFTQVFYGTSYQTRSQWEDYFKGILSEDYGQKFVDTYFPQVVMQGMDEEKVTQSFEPSGPARVLRVGTLSDDFRVEGTVTTQKGADLANQVTSSMPVALEVGLRHGPDGTGKVYKVKILRVEVN